MEWTTQSEPKQAETRDRNGAGAPGNGNGNDAHAHADGADQVTQTLPAQQAPPAPADSGPTPAAPAQPAAPHAPTLHPHDAAPPQPPAGYEHCQSCGALVAVDQRYCLACGVRRGDPRLPFMDAVVFMDAMKQPAPAQAGEPSRRKKRRLSPNAALIAGVGTLLLALGLGVLIGRSGGESGVAQQPQRIVVHQEGSGEAETASAGETEASGGSTTKAKKAKRVLPEEAKEAPSEQLLKPKKGVKLPPPTAEVGEKCVKGESGCNAKGEFDGSFFGE